MTLDLRIMVLVPGDGPNDPAQLAREAVSGGATVVQLRVKNQGTGAFWETVLDTAAVCAKAGVPLIVNDRLDLALAARTAGVHLGPQDLPLQPAAVLARPAGLALGASARRPERARDAERTGATYLGAGALRATRTKADAVVVGLEGITAVARAVSIPVVAVGGVLPEDAPSLKRSGVAGLAVWSGVADDVQNRTRVYRRAWDEA